MKTYPPQTYEDYDETMELVGDLSDVDLNEPIEGECEFSLPEWAEKKARGRFDVNAQLNTKDGRVTGNACLMEWEISEHTGSPVAICATDAGNVIRASFTELYQMFHPPIWIMQPMSIHFKAWQEEAEQ